MNYKYEYKTELERQNLLKSNDNLILVEEQNIKEGNFIIFSDVVPESKTVYTNVPIKEFTDLKSQLEIAQTAIDFLLMGGM